MNQIQSLKQAPSKKAEGFRFDIFKGKVDSEGNCVKIREAGHAFLNSGKHEYRVKLFSLQGTRFLIVPSGDRQEHYKILTQQEVKIRDDGKKGLKKMFTNVVGEAEILAAQSVMKLKFDLFGEPLYMSLYPSNAGNVLPFQLSPQWSVA
jgi:hypothetical protein